MQKKPRGLTSSQSRGPARKLSSTSRYTEHLETKACGQHVSIQKLSDHVLSRESDRHEIRESQALDNFTSVVGKRFHALLEAHIYLYTRLPQASDKLEYCSESMRDQ